MAMNQRSTQPMYEGRMFSSVVAAAAADAVSPTPLAVLEARGRSTGYYTTSSMRDFAKLAFKNASSVNGFIRQATAPSRSSGCEAKCA